MSVERIHDLLHAAIAKHLMLCIMEVSTSERVNAKTVVSLNAAMALGEFHDELVQAGLLHIGEVVLPNETETTH